MKITIKNVLSDKNTIAKAFRLNENCVEKNENNAVITIPDVEIQSEEGYYKLKKNETLQGLCARLSIPQIVMKKENENIAIKSGVTVFVPRFLGVSYVVKPLDTFSSIASRFGLSENEIKKKNGIDFLSPGLVLDVTKNNIDENYK